MMSKIVSVFIVVLIFLGLKYKKNTTIHRNLMLAAFSLDVILLLYVELTKNAIKTVIDTNHYFVVFHVFVSVAVLILYLVQIYLGFLMIKKNQLIRYRNTHKYIGISFVVFRLINLVTSFFINQFTNNVTG